MGKFNFLPAACSITRTKEVSFRIHTHMILKYAVITGTDTDVNFKRQSLPFVLLYRRDRQTGGQQ